MSDWELNIKAGWKSLSFGVLFRISMQRPTDCSTFIEHRIDRFGDEPANIQIQPPVSPVLTILSCIPVEWRPWWDTAWTADTTDGVCWLTKVPIRHHP